MPMTISTADNRKCQRKVIFPSKARRSYRGAYQYRWLISGVAGELLCRLSFFIGQMSVLVSTGSIFIIALDRYFLVFYPLKRVITLRIARRVIGVVWILAIAFAAPLFRMASLIAVNPGFLVCTIDFDIIHYIIFYFLLFFPFTITLPLIATIAIYIAIGIKLNQTKPPGHQLPPSQERRERMTHKTLAMLLTIVALLMVFRFPMIIGMIACFSGSRSFCDHFTVMFTVWFLTYTNSGINPWIYFIFNEQFRQGARSLLQRLIPCCFKATNEVDVTETDGLQMTTHAPRPWRENGTQRTLCLLILNLGLWPRTGYLNSAFAKQVYLRNTVHLLFSSCPAAFICVRVHFLSLFVVTAKQQHQNMISWHGDMFNLLSG